MNYHLLFVFLNIIVFGMAQQEGESCIKDGIAGICVKITNCQSAIDDVKRRKNPQICSFSGVNPIVCCLDSPGTTASPPVATTSTTPRSQTTTEYIPPVYDYQSNTGDASSGDCEAIDPAITSKKTGQKAWDKCIEYQEQLIYPCTKSVSLSGGMRRGQFCKHTAHQLIVGGTDAQPSEFPHMALLGFGEFPSVQWLCGGSIISERFILTAGHCTFSRDFGVLTYAMIGVLKRGDQVNNTNVYKINRIVKHPEYKPPNKYNDIALLETDRPMKLDQFVVPACLYVGNPVDDVKALATGWGATEHRGSVSDSLQKVTLTKFTREECSAKFRPERRMKDGYNETTQMCYGDRAQSKDTCQGDSGGPLQIYNKQVQCMYTIIGVTSFGKACGFVGDPGMYTRVVAYVPWIESIVWP